MVVGSAFLGMFGLLTLGIMPLVTVVGIPLGLIVLAVLFPAMLVIGYLVAGTWIGEMILGQSSPRVVRDRPFLASIVGLTALGLVSIIPGVGGLFSTHATGGAPAKQEHRAEPEEAARTCARRRSRACRPPAVAGAPAGWTNRR
jgi:hypothetical protein